MGIKSGRSVLGLLIILGVSLKDHTSALRIQQNNVTLDSTVVTAEVPVNNTLTQQKQAVENSTNRSIKLKKVAPTQGNFTVHVNSQNSSKKVVVKHMGGAKQNENVNITQGVQAKNVVVPAAEVGKVKQEEQTVDMYVIAQKNTTGQDALSTHAQPAVPQEEKQAAKTEDPRDIVDPFRFPSAPIGAGRPAAVQKQTQQQNLTSTKTADETTLMNKTALKAEAKKKKKEALLQAAARSQRKSAAEFAMMKNFKAHAQVNTTANGSKNVSVNESKNVTQNASLALHHFSEKLLSKLVESKEISSNESSLLSVDNSEQKQTSRHNGKELLQANANKDIIITVGENVSQTSDNKTAAVVAVQYPKPILPEVSQVKIQTLAAQGKWVGDADELTESNMKTAPTIAKLKQPKNLSNQTNAAKNQTVTVIPDPQPPQNQNIQTEEQKQTRHRVGRIVGKTQNAMIQRAIEAAGNASRGSNQSEEFKEMVQKEEIQVQEQAENIQNLKDASAGEVERGNADRMQAQIDEEKEIEKKAAAAAKGKKNLSAKIGKNIAQNIAVATQKDTQAPKQQQVISKDKVTEKSQPQQQKKVIEAAVATPAVASADQSTFQKLQQLDKQDAKQQALEVTDDGDQEDLQLFQKVPKTELEAVEIQLKELEQIKLVAKKLKSLRDQRDKEKEMFDKAGGKLAQIRQDITENKHDLERMYRKAGIEKPAMV